MRDFVFVFFDMFLLVNINSTRSFPSFCRVSMPLYLHESARHLRFLFLMDIVTRRIRHYDVQFIQTQRNGDIPVVNRYPFQTKDRDRVRDRYLTWSRKATILPRFGPTGTYYEGTPSRNRQQHDEFINGMKRRKSMK